MRGHIDVPAALFGTCLTVGAVDPTAFLDILFPCHTSKLPTKRRAVLRDTGKLKGWDRATQGRVVIGQRKAGLGLSSVGQGWD